MSSLQNFTTEERLSNHKKQYLLINECQAVKYESGIIKFTNHNKQIPILFKMYADTERFLKRTNIKEGEYTTKYQEHQPNSIAAKLVCIDDRFTLPTIIFKGKDCIIKFITWVLDKQKWTQQTTKKYFNKRLLMTSEDEEIYNNSQICWICDEKLDKTNVKDLYHITGKFRGAAHNKCSLKLRIPRKLPIIFRNLQGYDGHIIFKELNNVDVDVAVIPKGINKYMNIIINRHITFIDSVQFYISSLDTLASNLKDEDFKYLASEFGIDKIRILKRKDAYLYEWVDSYEKFKHPSLPERNCFYSSLKDDERDNNDGHISDDQYLDLQNVWDIFNFNTLEDFHDHYLKKDVLLLADIIEKFISTDLKYHGLDPCHYFSAPGLSWDAMLKMTKIELEKIGDPDKYMFFEQGMRGGVSYIIKRYSKANNEYCKDYDKEKPKNYIIHLDMNNLYGYAMSQHLTYANFKWVKDFNKIKQKINAN